MTTAARKINRTQRWLAMAEDAGLHLEFEHYRRWRVFKYNLPQSGYTVCTKEQAQNRTDNSDGVYTYQCLAANGFTRAKLVNSTGKVVASHDFHFHQVPHTYYSPDGKKDIYYTPRNYNKTVGRQAASGILLRSYFVG